MTFHAGVTEETKGPCPCHPRAQGGWQQPLLPRPVSSSRLLTLQSIIPLGSLPQKTPLSPSMGPVQRHVTTGCPSSTRRGALELKGSTPWRAKLPWPVSSHPLIGSATQAFSTVSLMSGKCTKAADVEPLCTTTGKQGEFLHPENSLFSPL